MRRFVFERFLKTFTVNYVLFECVCFYKHVPFQSTGSHCYLNLMDSFVLRVEDNYKSACDFTSRTPVANFHNQPDTT